MEGFLYLLFAQPSLFLVIPHKEEGRVWRTWLPLKAVLRPRSPEGLRPKGPASPECPHLPSQLWHLSGCRPGRLPWAVSLPLPLPREREARARALRGELSPSCCAQRGRAQAAFPLPSAGLWHPGAQMPGPDVLEFVSRFQVNSLHVPWVRAWPPGSPLLRTAQPASRARRSATKWAVTFCQLGAG